MDEKTITVGNFIRSYLIDHIGEIKKLYPYESFLLISCGIEFLGKCINRRDWHESGHSGADFNTAIRAFPSLSKYEKEDLYSKVRCGLCHAFQVKEGMLLSNLETEDAVSVDEFYEAFKSACETLLENSDYCDLLEKDFFNIKEESGVSITGNTDASFSSYVS